MTRRAHQAAAAALLGVAAAVVVVLLILGHGTGALWVAVGANVAVTAAPLLERRSGRAASPPARTEITRTTGGRPDGRIREHEGQ